MLVAGAVGLWGFGSRAIQGYQRRKVEWTRPQWRKFLMILGVSMLFLITSSGMAIGVDMGIYNGMSETLHRWYFRILVATMTIGAISFGLTMTWFRGRDDD